VKDAHTLPFKHLEMENTRLVLLHGAGLGAWVWKNVEPLLKMPSVAVDFPDRDRYKPDHSLDLDSYCRTILDTISKWPREKVILVAHSISGVVACRLAAELGERLVAFAGISAVVPENGGSFLSAFPFARRAMTWITMSLGGTRPPNSQIVKAYCNDLTREECDLVLTRYVPESLLLYTQPTEYLLPANIPKCYVMLTKDRSLDESNQQRMIKHLDADRVASIDAGHLAMISEPRKVADALNTFFNHSPKNKSKGNLEPVHP
jgi:pimeloyl-ACP methyl ester carboxylesterase